MTVEITTATGEEMLQSVTPIYRNDEQALAIFEANGKVMDELAVVIEGLKTEMYPQNATWTLSYWEQMLGIKTNKNLSDAVRVQGILFELNKYFTVTRYRIERIINVHVQNRDAKVIEDEGEYSFTIQIPSDNLIITADIHKDVEEVKPAHLAYMISVMTGKLTAYINAKQYAFSVPYAVTGTFHTAPISGVATKTATEVEGKTYVNPVPYPVTGTFYCSEGGV